MEFPSRSSYLVHAQSFQSRQTTSDHAVRWSAGEKKKWWMDCFQSKRLLLKMRQLRARLVSLRVEVDRSSSSLSFRDVRCGEDGLKIQIFRKRLCCCAASSRGMRDRNSATCCWSTANQTAARLTLNFTFFIDLPGLFLICSRRQRKTN